MKQTKWQRLAAYRDEMEALIRERAYTPCPSDRWESILARLTVLRGQIDSIRAILLDLEDACREMVLEQGMAPCGLGFCGRAATHVWHRTAKELKAIQRKHKGQALTGEPVSIRCELHVPDWRVSEYRPLTAAPVAAVA